MGGIESSGRTRFPEYAQSIRFVFSTNQICREVRESQTSSVGQSQSSRSLPQARRIVGSGDENAGIKAWKVNYADTYTEWKNRFSFIYQTTRDNKLRQFSFRLLHGIIVTKKDLLKFRLTNDATCILCPNSDSIEHTFLDYSEIKIILIKNKTQTAEINILNLFIFIMT